MEYQIEEIELTEISSTQDYAKEYISQLNPETVVCISALAQTAGRGRYGRTWFSPPHENLYVSFLFLLPKDFKEIQELTMLLSLSCIKVLLQFPIAPKIKWPNDIFLDEKKLGGVLCELTHKSENTYAILGVGLNLNTPQNILQQSISVPVTSLASELHVQFNRTQILNCLKQIFIKDLECLFKKGFVSFQDLYNSFLI